MNHRFFFSRNQLLWLGLGLAAVALRALLPPEAIEAAYSRGLYRVVRQVFSGLTAWLPFAVVYVIFPLLVAWLAWEVVRFFRRRQKWAARLLGLLRWWVAFAGGVVFLFLFLWGFNYGRVPLEDQLSIDPKPLKINEMREELDAATAEVLRLRRQLAPPTDSALTADLLPPDLERTMRTALTHQLTELGYPATATVRGRLLWPDGLLLRISTAGVYIPFTGEGHVDPGLHHLQLPFVLAHEMAHGYGHGDEGTCNFLAYLTCIHSDDPYLQYVGHLYFWRYVASDYRFYQPEEYSVFYQELPAGLRNDLRAIRQQMDKYPDLLPQVRDATYNAYLKAQGISEGMENYDRVTMLVRAWRSAKGPANR